MRPDKIIDSHSLKKLAKDKSKDLSRYFDPFEECEDMTVLEKTLLIALYNFFCCIKRRDISKETATYHIIRIEKELQELAAVLESANKDFDEKTILAFSVQYSKWQKALKEKDYYNACGIAAELLNYANTPDDTIDYKSMFEYY